jgi:hypothetical protein
MQLRRIADLPVGHLARVMSEKAYFVAVGCLIAGLFLGVGGAYFCGAAYSGKQIADGLALFKEIEIAESGQRAFAAYQHESPQIAIYALSQYLETLKKTEEMAGENAVFMTKSGINFDTMLARARLARVYAAAGQPDRSALHIAEALKRASQDLRLQTITNESLLTEIVASIDKGATK